MNATRGKGWREVYAELLRRIREREWAPGRQVPGEADLALELGCSRATCSRAMRELAAEGLLDRRRKAGTSVAEYPVGRARLAIPVIRLEVEGSGAKWRQILLQRRVAVPPASIAAVMELAPREAALFLRGVHFADNRPVIDEYRWINTAMLPQALDIDFSAVSANEWLVRNAAYTRGDMEFYARAAEADEAENLEIAEGTSVFLAERQTWYADRTVTFVRLCHAPGYRMKAAL